MATKRQYTKKQIKLIAIQAAIRAISEAKRTENFLDESFIVETSIFVQGDNSSYRHNDYPYRTEVFNELMKIEWQLRNRLVKLSQ